MKLVFFAIAQTVCEGAKMESINLKILPFSKLYT